MIQRPMPIAMVSQNRRWHPAQRAAAAQDDRADGDRREQQADVAEHRQRERAGREQPAQSA